MTDKTPRTEAGRGLRDAWPQLARTVSDPVHLILAIEAEAAAQARTEARPVPLSQSLDAAVRTIRYSEPLLHGTPEHDRWLYTEELARAILAGETE